MTIFQADLIRLVAGLAAGWSLIMTVAILYAFTSRVGWGFGWRNLIARKKTHIFSVSLGFVILSLYAIIELSLRIGTLMTWRGPMLFVAFAISGFGQYLMLSAQLQEGREEAYKGTERRKTTTIPPEPVLALIERVMLTLSRIEGVQMTGADSMARMEDAAHTVAADLHSSQARADQIKNGLPGAAADAGAQSGSIEEDK